MEPSTFAEQQEPPTYAVQRYNDGRDYASRATQYDMNGNSTAALLFYDEAVEAFTHAIFMDRTYRDRVMPLVLEYSKKSMDIRSYLSSERAKEGK